MPVRRAAPSSKPSPKPSGHAENEPTREALLAALAERERELAGAREQQAAVAQVLEVINASPGDLAAVFDAIVEKGGRLCDATNSGLWLVEDGTARLASLHSGKATAPKPLLASVPAADILGRRNKDQPFLHIEDLKATKAYRQGVPLIVASVDVEGVRTCLVTPLHDGERIVGVFVLTRDQVRPFADRQIALAHAFAGQAQIAMKNAQLFNETREALARQTATAEILRVISQSPTDARPVFESIVVTAARLLRCDMAFVLLREGDAYVHTAVATPEGPMPDLAPERIPIDPSANFPSRAFLAKTMLHLPDWSQIDLPEHERRIHEMFGVNSVLYLPLLRGDECIGLLAVGGRRANIFGPSEIAQAESFRDQALIAMENARLFNETQEALERQTATAEVLKVIASSPSDVQPVFDAIATSANRLLGGFSTTVIRFVGDALHLVAFTPTNVVADEALQAAFPRPIADFPPFVLVRDGETQQFVDTEAESGVPPVIRELARLRGYRSMLFTPLMSKDAAIGMISVTRKEPGAFAADDVKLLRTFADQAVIAIQNASLFNETQEALGRQTATAEILRVISQSPTDARPVFERIVLTAARVLQCDLAVALLRDGDTYSPVAGANAQGLLTDFVPALRVPIDPNANFPSRAILGKTMLHLPDWSLIDVPPHERVIQNLIGANSSIYLPLLREDECIGVLALVGNRPNRFGPKEIAQAESFRDQALIAIENARLFRETQEALEQQKASAEVLGAISKSVADTAPVFETILDACQRLFGSEEIGIYTIGDDDMVRVGAWRGPRAEEARRDVTPLAESVTGRIIRERSTHHIPDLGALANLSPTLRERVDRHGGASLLYAPMLWEERGLGSILVVRWPPRPFSDREQALLQTFADQAAIAVQNARLFSETQEALEHQKASGEVLRAIAQSVADATPVFENILDASQRLFGTEEVCIFMVGEDGMVRPAAARGPGFSAARNDVMPLEGSRTGRVIRERRVHHIPDGLAEPGTPPALLERMRRSGNVSIAFAPMLWEDSGLGSIAILRSPPRPFSERELELLRGFADQAVIAIQNARMFREVQAKTRDLEESLAQQTATADVLKVISRSVLDLDSVLQTLIDTAVRLARGSRGTIFIQRDDVLVASAFHSNVPADLREYLATTTWRLDGDSHRARAAREGRVVHVPNLSKLEDKTTQEVRKRAAYGAGLWVPLIGEKQTIGVFGVPRDEPVAFTDREIEIVKTFADQAVIAIENARLFEEVQAKSRDLAEALQQQTATSEVLKVISRSAFDLDAVLNGLTRSAVELCSSTYGAISLYRDGVLKFMAQTGCTPEFAELLWSHPAQLDRKSATGRAGLLRTVVLVPDVTQDEEYDYHGGEIIGNYRSMMAVPLLRNGELEGVFTLMRGEPGTFTQRQVELVETFADQAVIAIENARLFDEVQARTRDLSEALAQQTATAEVLKVISRSAFDLSLATSTILEAAAKLCRAPLATLHLRDGEVCRLVTQFGLPEAFERQARENPIPARYPLHSRRPARAGDVAHFPDAWNDPDYLYTTTAKLAGYRAIVVIPLMRDDELVGILSLGRPEPDPFTPSQIKLVQTFADQAAIAIENARLFNEVKARTEDLSEALQQQTATADVLKVISRSAFDVQAVLNTLVESAQRLCNAQRSVIFLKDGDGYRVSAQIGMPEAFLQHRRANPLRAGRGTPASFVALTGEIVNTPDVLADPDFSQDAAQQLGGFRAALALPLVRDKQMIGIFALSRPEPGAFTQGQVKLVQTFADQAAIAIENVRLFEEVQARTRDLSEALQLQTATSEVLKVISRSAFDLQAVFDTLISSAVELCSAFSGSICVRDGEVFRYTGSAGVGANPALHEYLTKHPAAPGRGTMVGRVLLSGKVEHIRDRFEDEEYAVPTAAFGNTSRAFLGVPLLGKAGIEGALVLTREEPGHFSDRQIEIVQTFADQAVIAIENVRLFDEVQARTQELTQSLDDLRKAQDRLIQSEKLASLGQLTAGIAHEIKNPLNFVNNFSALSRELVGELGETLKGAPLDEAQREETDELIGTIAGNLDKVVSHGKRADSIVKNMLLHSREGSGERTSVNVNAMVEEALNLGYHGARAEKPGFNVTIAKSLDDRAGSAEIYAQEMTRVLLNLISNAFYATTKRKQAEGDESYEPTITASTRDLGDSVEIAVRDNGTGIPDEVKTKMFNPFFTTKPAGEGTGLGLSLSHDIVVKQHGGTFEVSTEPGSYTQFTIVLPRAGAAS